MHNLLAKGPGDVEEQLLFEDLSPHCDLDLEDRNPTFSHDTPGHDDAPSYQGWLYTA